MLRPGSCLSPAMPMRHYVANAPRRRQMRRPRLTYATIFGAFASIKGRPNIRRAFVFIFVIELIGGAEARGVSPRFPEKIETGTPPLVERIAIEDAPPASQNSLPRVIQRRDEAERAHQRKPEGPTRPLSGFASRVRGLPLGAKVIFAAIPIGAAWPLLFGALSRLDGLGRARDRRWGGLLVCLAAALLGVSAAFWWWARA